MSHAAPPYNQGCNQVLRHQLSIIGTAHIAKFQAKALQFYLFGEL
jgi:hypothetical protein